MREILPGVFHWTTFHEPIGAQVSSYYVAPAGIVVDPKVPEEGFDALPDAPQQVVLTSGLHHRDAAPFAERYGIPVRASREAARRLGDRLAVAPIQIGKLCPDEDALHIAAGEGDGGGAIAFADGLTRYGGALGFVPDALLGDDPQGVKDGLKEAFRGLLVRDFDHLLFAHGEPLVGGGKAALRAFVESPVGHEDYGQVQ
jgi:hypothetical protein